MSLYLKTFFVILTKMFCNHFIKISKLRNLILDFSVSKTFFIILTKMFSLTFCDFAWTWKWWECGSAEHLLWLAFLPFWLLTLTILCLSVREYEIIKLLTLSNISILKQEDDIFHFFESNKNIFKHISFTNV